MDERSLQRQCIEEVFRVHGELETKPFMCKEADDEDDEGREREFAYWYTGVPDYAHDDFEDRDDEEYITIILADCQAPNYLVVEKDGTRNTWQFEESYASSGEVECPYRASGEPSDKEVITDHLEPSISSSLCPFCDEKIGDSHGFIYLGDGWCEAVYKFTDEEVIDELEPEADTVVEAPTIDPSSGLTLPRYVDLMEKMHMDRFYQTMAASITPASVYVPRVMTGRLSAAKPHLANMPRATSMLVDRGMCLHAHPTLGYCQLSGHGDDVPHQFPSDREEQ